MARLEIDLIGNNSSLIKSIQGAKDAFDKLAETAKGVGKIKVDLSLGDTISNLKALNKVLGETSKLYKDLGKTISSINSTTRGSVGGAGTKQALEAEKLALARAKTEAARYREETARLNAEITRLRLNTAQSRQATVAAIGSYREAQQKLTALGNAIRNAEGGFRSKNATIRAQIAEYRRLNEQLKAFDREMGINTRNVGNYRSALGAIGSQLMSLAGAYLSVHSAMLLVNKSFSTALKVDALQASFAFILSDSTERIEALRQQANRLGVDFLTLTETNKKFIAAAKASNFSLSQADKIFNSVANAGAKLKLSNEQIGGTFLAIEQMISKGTVSMEELRRQLGDRLPGAFALAAKAMGVTEAEFNKMVANGEVMAKDLLPRLAEMLDKVYGNDTNKKILSLQASTNRLNNTFTEIVMNSGIQSFFRGVVDAATNVLDIFNRIISTPLSKKLQDESRDLEIMRLELDSTNTSAERRLELIQELVAKYPAYLSHIDTEKVTNGELLPILQKINEAYAHRIAYQKLMEQAGDIGETQAQLQLDRFNAQQKVLSDIAKIQGIINKHGIDFQISGDNELEKAQNIIENIRKTPINTKAFGELNKVLGSLETGVGYLNMYDNALERNGRLFDDATKKARDFAESVGMFDGTSRDAVTQLDALQKAMIKIQDSPKLTRSEKDAFAHRLALAGYDAETQKKVLAEVERLEMERTKAAADAAGKGANKLEQAIIDSNNRVALAETEGREKDIERIRQWYASRLKLAAAGSEAYQLLERNMRAEIDAINREYDSKELAKVQEFIKKRNETIQKNAIKIRDENRKLDIEELQVSLSYQRRLWENRAQVALRGLNAEYKLKEESLNKWIESEINAGRSRVDVEREVNAKKLKLQEELFQKIETLTAQQRELDIQAAFDGDALSVPLARINDQINELRRSFQGLTEGEVEAFRQKISDLELQRQQLQLIQGTVDNISESFGNLYADAIFDTENAMENLGKAFENTAKSIISGLIKIGVRYLINQAIGTASMNATALASATTAKAVAASWATAAALASAATFGGSAAAGGIALGALISSTKALAGFAKGGYTGNVGRHEVAGLVHGQEFVINAQATRDNLPLLKAINAGVDVKGLMSGQSYSNLNYGKIDPNRAQRLVIEQDEIRIGHDAIYISFKIGERSNNRFFGGR